MNRLVEWDSFDLRVNGEKLNALVQTMLGGSTPIEWIRIEFRNGLMRVTGAIRKFISVPFTVDITEIQARGTTIRIPLRNASAAGFPVPMILFGLLRSQLPKDLVSYEEPATLVMSLDRFLPSFIAADVKTIYIIDGGLAVTLGRGGADLPQPMSTNHDDHHE